MNWNRQVLPTILLFDCCICKISLSNNSKCHIFASSWSFSILFDRRCSAQCLLFAPERTKDEMKQALFTNNSSISLLHLQNCAFQKFELQNFFLLIRSAISRRVLGLFQYFLIDVAALGVFFSFLEGRKMNWNGQFLPTIFLFDCCIC